MLKKVRQTLAAVAFTLITLLFVDVSGLLHGWLSWLAEIQFLPALLALNVGVVVALVALTLIFGRIYCSVICPLGVMQDLISRLHSRLKKNRFSHSPERKALRYGFLALFVVALVAGGGSLAALLAPYSSYGRMAENLLRPLWAAGNNVLAAMAERTDSYAFYSVDVWVKSLPTFIIAAVSLVVIGWLAWRGGRTYCNTVCPCRHCARLAGTLLVAQGAHRHRQMQRLRTMRAQLQGFMHRLQGAQDRLFALRGLRRLHRQVPPRGAQLRQCAAPLHLFT